VSELRQFACVIQLEEGPGITAELVGRCLIDFVGSQDELGGASEFPKGGGMFHVQRSRAGASRLNLEFQCSCFECLLHPLHDKPEARGRWSRKWLVACYASPPGIVVASHGLVGLPGINSRRGVVVSFTGGEACQNYRTE
jgi:hypothetical protein